ncbi:MAG: GNAT family N-acetyltransferase [Rhodospirillaceae bacterium]|nr:GNAT family N-acetyltransferase [Rhodospirillaceae bacterium]|tara:strand:- start:10067 stop:11230 length:1164 start_codon:yes stop_codon:yes gene_type:complete
MPDGDAIAVKVTNCIAEVDAEQWDACAGPDNPFVSHAFLDILEQSGSASAESGWLPQHLLLEDASGQLVGAVPAYLKNHSYGEYVFDWGWADAFERAGGKYYPKLQVSVPFSPVTGPRLLVRPGPDANETRRILVAGLRELANQHEVSSLHITFCEEAERDFLEDQQFLKRLGKQFHWHNRGYETFDDFLGTLNSRKRKTIRKERQIANKDAEINVLSGDDLKPEHMDAFYQFYLTTVEKKWAHAYLNRDFFMLMQERLAEKVVMVMASDDGNYVGAALNLCGSDTLFGRNWGGSSQYRMLYFEACFYRAIEYAIEHGLARVEAGAQGPHKISRGYLPSETYSAHWIRDPAFRDAVANFLVREAKETEWEMDILEDERSPYRKDLEL